MEAIKSFQITASNDYLKSPTVLIVKMVDDGALRTFRRTGITVPGALERAVYVEEMFPKPVSNPHYVLDDGYLWESGQWHKEHRPE